MLSDMAKANNDSKPLLIVLLGPTAVGKTSFSLQLAKQFNGEIISGDSMQVYQHMDIGTAKASKEEQANIPHHLLDIKRPDESFSVAEFQTLARAAIEQIHARQNIPFLVGGTGLYIEALCYNFDFDTVQSDHSYRQHLLQVARQFGNEALHQKLQQVDPVAAARIHRNDQRRMIRALEVYKLTGEPITAQRRSDAKRSPYDLCLIGLTMDRTILYKRIEERIDQMIQKGLVDEVQALLAEGYTSDSTAMQAIGYKEIIGYIQGEYDWNTAVTLLQRNSRRYAKRQWSWFRRMNNVYWVDVTDTTKFHAHLSVMNDIIQSKITARHRK